MLSIEEKNGAPARAGSLLRSTVSRVKLGTRDRAKGDHVDDVILPSSQVLGNLYRGKKQTFFVKVHFGLPLLNYQTAPSQVPSTEPIAVDFATLFSF